MAIGVSDFYKLRSAGYLYVDKSSFIKEIIEAPAEVILLPADRELKGILMEFKRVNVRRKETPEKALEKAMAQIESRGYDAELRGAGVKEILQLAVAFSGQGSLGKIKEIMGYEMRKIFLGMLSFFAIFSISGAEDAPPGEKMGIFLEKGFSLEKSVQ